MDKKKTKRRRLVGNIALSICTVLILLLLSEIATRIFLVKDMGMGLFPRYHSSAVYGDFRLRTLRPKTVYRHRSVDGSWEFRINAQGFRNDFDFDYRKGPGVTRIVCIGDSQTEGLEVRQNRTYSAILAKFLKDRGVNAEVYNMGVAGYSTSEALILLENEIVRYSPDYVVLGFYANDYEDNVRAGLFAMKDGKLTLSKKEYIPGVKILDFINRFYVIRKLSENSYLYSFVFNNVWNFAKRRTALRAEAEYILPSKSSRTDYEVGLTTLLIGRMAAFCKAHGIRFIVVDIPDVETGGFKSSMQEKLRDYLRASPDAVSMESEAALGRYRGYIDIHVPHGSRHISEFTHMVLGMEAGRIIMSEKRGSK
jgi:hypothetical protein